MIVLKFASLFLIIGCCFYGLFFYFLLFEKGSFSNTPKQVRCGIHVSYTYRSPNQLKFSYTQEISFYIVVTLDLYNRFRIDVIKHSPELFVMMLNFS